MKYIYIIIAINFFTVSLTRADKNIHYSMTAIFNKDVTVTKYAVLYIYETKQFQVGEIRNKTFSFNGTLQLKNDIDYGNGIIILTNKADYSSVDIKRDLTSSDRIPCIIEPNFSLIVNEIYAQSILTGQLNDISMKFSVIEWKYNEIWANQNKKIALIRKSITKNTAANIKLQKENEVKGILSELVLVSTPAKLREIYNLINNNVNSTIAFSKLYVLGRSKHFSIDEISVVFNKFSDEFRNSTKGKMLSSIIKDKTNIEKDDLHIGDQALSFTLIDVNKQPVSLEKYKGKYVLIEFWASWCGPCRAEMPALKEAKENNKELVILTISIDIDKDSTKWLKAISDDGISSFTNLIDSKWEVAKIYGVRLIPQNFLIDKEGLIIGKNLYNKELRKKLDDLIN